MAGPEAEIMDTKAFQERLGVRHPRLLQEGRIQNVLGLLIQSC